MSVTAHNAYWSVQHGNLNLVHRYDSCWCCVTLLYGRNRRYIGERFAFWVGKCILFSNNFIFQCFINYFWMLFFKIKSIKDYYVLAHSVFLIGIFFYIKNLNAISVRRYIAAQCIWNILNTTNINRTAGA